jgi:glycosyltransferase involved in cell wall biosynthesis
MQTKRKVKIFYATAADVTKLGAPRSIDIQVVTNLQRLGYEVFWFGINIDSCEEFKGPIISLNISKISSLRERALYKISRILRLQTGDEQKLIAQRKFDKWMSRILKEKKEEIDSNVVFIGRAVSSELSFQVVKKYGGRCVLHSQWMHPVKHTRMLEDAFSDAGNSYRPIPAERIQKQLREIELCDKVWCISKLVFDSYLENGVPREKLFLSPLGVDISYFKPKEIASKGSSGHLVILFVGNINIEKGIHILIEAILVSGISKCKLILNGAVADYFKSTLDRMLESLNSVGVDVSIGSGDPLENFQKADIFILPSLHESFGLVVLEAMACGLPVIVTDQVGASDHVLDGENGFIVPAASAEALVGKIRFLNFNRDQCLKFGEKSRDLSKSLSWSSVARLFVSEIEK